MAGRLGPWLLAIALVAAALYAWIEGAGPPAAIGRGSRRFDPARPAPHGGER